MQSPQTEQVSEKLVAYITVSNIVNEGIRSTLCVSGHQCRVTQRGEEHEEDYEVKYLV